MYLIIFATLAVGFYASANTGSIVAFNERITSRAQVADESGLEFALRFSTRYVVVPSTYDEIKP